MPKIYTTLFKRYKDQPTNEVFAHFGWKAKEGEGWETPFERLANLAKPEDWNFITSRFKRVDQNYPILMNYLNYTFLRIQELGLISYSEDGSRACFNTGLQTRDEKDIYATFFSNKKASEHNYPDWTLFAFADSYSEKISSFQPLPQVATYITDASELVFDLSYDIEINIAHIIDKNKDRLPEVLQSNRTLAMATIEGATKFLKQKVLRNYKVAIPHWYSNKIQLLLPLNITSDTEADLALVADKDKERVIYRIRTALPMDMAYINARLICQQFPKA